MKAAVSKVTWLRKATLAARNRLILRIRMRYRPGVPLHDNSYLRDCYIKIASILIMKALSSHQKVSWRIQITWFFYPYRNNFTLEVTNYSWNVLWRIENSDPPPYCKVTCTSLYFFVGIHSKSQRPPQKETPQKLDQRNPIITTTSVIVADDANESKKPAEVHLIGAASRAACLRTRTRVRTSATISPHKYPHLRGTPPTSLKE